MRIARLAAGVIVLTAIAFMACNDDSILPDSAGGTIVVNPVCGTAGDKVTIIVPDRDGRCDDAYFIRFHPGVEVKDAAVLIGNGGTCTVSASVPEGARTGIVEVVRVGDEDKNTLDHTFVTNGPFTVPCPGDAAPPDSPPDAAPDSGEPTFPLNAVWVQRRFGTSTIVNTDGFTYASGMTPAQAAALAKRDAIITSAMDPPNVPIGTCATVDLPDPGPDEPKPIYRGSFTVKAGAKTVINGINCGPDFHYRQPYTWADFYEGLNDDWEIGWAGERTEPGFSIPNAAARVHPFLVTAPNAATPDVDVPQGDFTVTWSPTLVKLLTLHFLRTSGAPVICAVDPTAGSFKVPASVIGGPGELFMDVFAGDLRRLYIAQIAHAMLAMSVHHYEFTLHVQ